ncbi:hypothetical protein CL634_00395 [bacterium]|nr:hypothetical protein [bacterium]
MKLTKHQLKQLIKEELRKVLNEHDSTAGMGNCDPPCSPGQNCKRRIAADGRDYSECVPAPSTAVDPRIHGMRALKFAEKAHKIVLQLVQARACEGSDLNHVEYNLFQAIKQLKEVGKRP